MSSSTATTESPKGGFLRVNFSNFPDENDETIQLRKQNDDDWTPFSNKFGEVSPSRYDSTEQNDLEIKCQVEEEDSFEQELSTALKQMSIPMETAESPDTSLDISGNQVFEMRHKTTFESPDIHLFGDSSSSPLKPLLKKSNDELKCFTPPKIVRKGTPPQKLSSHRYGTPPQKVTYDEVDTTPKTCNTSYNESSLLGDQNSCLAEPVVEASFETMDSDTNKNRTRSYFDESFISMTTADIDASFVRESQESFFDQVDTVVDKFMCTVGTVFACDGAGSRNAAHTQQQQLP